MMWVLTIVFIASVIFYLWYLRNKKYKDIDKIPGPPVRPLLGNVLEFGTSLSDIFYNTQRIIKTYGPLVRIWKGPFELNLFVTEPKYVEYFLSSSVHIKKSADYNGLQAWMGNSLINSSGEKWKQHRKILTPAFHFKILEQFPDTFHNVGKILINLLRKETGKEVDIYRYIKMYSMDVICESSMRINARVQENWDETYINACAGFLDIFLKRFFSVIKRYDVFFKLTNDYKEQQKHVKTLTSFTRGVIEKRKMERDHSVVEEKVDDMGIKKKKVFLDILLDSNELTDQEIREEVDTFIFAGHDTVSTAMSFGIFELAKHNDVQSGLLEEIEAVVGSNTNLEITLNHLQNMNYLDRVVKELLRLYPSAPFIERQLTEDVTLDGMHIPKGTTISFHPYAQHRNEKLFPNPENFEPDRFLPENVSKRHPFAYIPFSAGPRNCIGQRYAMMNFKITLCNVIRNFKIFPVEPAHKPLLANDGVLKSLNGLPVKLIPRN